MIWQQVVGALCSVKKLLLGAHHVLEDTVVFKTKSLSWSFQVECKVIETGGQVHLKELGWSGQVCVWR